jgi:hypothetical protein
MSSRILSRLAKEDAEREAQYLKDADKREARYLEIDALLKEYEAERVRVPFTLSEDARRLWNHLVSEYGHEFVVIYRRMREGKPL